MAASKWASLNFAKTLLSKLKSDWRKLTLAQRRVWARYILAGIVATTATLFALILLHRAISAGANQFAWEEQVLRAIEAGPIGFATAVWLQTLGSDFMLAAVLISAAALAIWRDRPLLALTLFMSVVVMDAIVRVGWVSLARHRPDIIAQGIASPGFHSFPSGHTSKTVVLYSLLAAEWFKASRSHVEKTLIVILTVLIALVVPYGRLRMGVHWPTDILAGYALAAVWLCFAIPAVWQEQRS